MAAHRTGPLHWVGVFFMLAASVLLLITTISAPVVNDIGILKVKLSNTTSNGDQSAVSFGTFGYCVLNVASSTTNDNDDWCTGKHIGYKIGKIMEGIDQTSYSSASVHTADGLTNAMVLHPVATGVAFLAFLAALGTGICGALFGALLAFVAWVITLVVMVIDFVLFGIIKHKVNEDSSGSRASYSVGMWTCLVAMLLLFFGQFIVFFTCFTNRRHSRRSTTTTTKYPNDYGNTTYRARRKRFGIF